MLPANAATIADLIIQTVAKGLVLKGTPVRVFPAKVAVDRCCDFRKGISETFENDEPVGSVVFAFDSFKGFDTLSETFKSCE